MKLHDCDALEVRSSVDGDGKRVGGSSGMFPFKHYSEGDMSPGCYEQQGLVGIAEPLFPRTYLNLYISCPKLPHTYSCNLARTHCRTNVSQ